MAARSDGGVWLGFLATAFGVVGLVGAFATYAAQIPFERLQARNATLDQVLVIAGKPNPQPAFYELRPLLDDSAERVLGPVDGIQARVATERVRLMASFGAEARDIGRRLRIVLSVFTLAGALFGAFVLGLVRRQGQGG